MNTEQILMCVVALILGMLLANMLKSVCGCKVVEGKAPGATVQGTCIIDAKEFSVQFPGGNNDKKDDRIEACKAQTNQAHCEDLGQNLGYGHNWCIWKTN